MKLEITNRSSYDCSTKALEGLIRELYELLSGLPERLSIALVDSPEMARLNRDYYGKQGSTDVLVFPYEQQFAEIVLNPQQQFLQAAEFGNSGPGEFVENIIHALLHLTGYDHTAEEDEGRHLQKQAELIEDQRLLVWLDKLELEKTQ